MHKVNLGKETVKFLAVFDHPCARSSLFFLLAPVRSCRFNNLTFQPFDVLPVQLSPTQSNQIQLNPTTPPLPVKKSVKKR
jgi:hypothetical protein